MPYRLICRFLASWIPLASLLMSPDIQAITLRGSEWRPVQIGEAAVPESISAFVQFRSKGRIHGYGGCNRLFAEYQVEGGRIFIGPVAATRRVCAQDVMAQEAALARALEGARTFQRYRIRLVLFDKDGIPILELRQTDWD